MFDQRKNKHSKCSSEQDFAHYAQVDPNLFRYHFPPLFSACFLCCLAAPQGYSHGGLWIILQPLWPQSQKIMSATHVDVLNCLYLREIRADQ